jgi:hypothetical protein
MAAFSPRGKSGQSKRPDGMRFSMNSATETNLRNFTTEAQRHRGRSFNLDKQPRHWPQKGAELRKKNLRNHPVCFLRFLRLFAATSEVPLLSVSLCLGGEIPGFRGIDEACRA